MGSGSPEAVVMTYPLNPRNPAPYWMSESTRRDTQTTLLSLHACALEMQRLVQRSEGEVDAALDVVDSRLASMRAPWADAERAG